jgi:hypothetical protein
VCGNVLLDHGVGTKGRRDLTHQVDHHGPGFLVPYRQCETIGTAAAEVAETEIAQIAERQHFDVIANACMQTTTRRCRQVA